MLVSLEWLKEYVDFDLSPQDLAEALTMVGLEVEEIINTSIEGLDKVVVGKIIDCKPHPNANKLSLCLVDKGSGDPVSVVCGAPNARKGLLSPLALVGAELPGGFKIEVAKIRGEESYGMLCSEKELKLGNDADGIMELPNDSIPGTPIVSALGLNDVIFNIELTSNRSDCLSIMGIAREVSAITGNPLKKPEITFLEANTKASDLTSVTISAPDLCRRYAARLVLGAKIAPSPFWMRRRLESVGLRAINNVVDVTNYVLMELGHPLHAFDFEKLSGKRIIVRRAKPEEHITTLDEIERTLTPDMLVIADAEKPVAVAGVMGGLGSDVTDETTNILIESAYFNPVSISKTSKALGMHTEASHRFERGTDIEGLITALNRTAQLIQNSAGGDICKGIVDIYPVPYEKIEVKLRPKRANSILGTSLEPKDMAKLLESIEFKVRNDNDDLLVTVPSFRPDVSREIDLIEEIARLYGYNNIPVTMPASEIPYESDLESLNEKKILYRERVRNALNACGLTEVLNYSFHDPSAFDRLELEADSMFRNALILRNPISENQSVIRTTLIPGLLSNISYNLNRRINDIRIFEIGRVFHPREGKKQPDEPEYISGAITGQFNSKIWNQQTRPVDFYDIKGAIESILEVFGIKNYTFSTTSRPPFLNGRCAEVIVENKTLGIFGEIRRSVLDKHDIDQDVYAFELEFDKLLEYTSFATFQQLPIYPSVYRDISLVLNFNVLHSDIEEAIKSIGGKLILSVNLFDVYKGKQIPENKKSLAYAIEYYSPDRTLTDEEVDEIHERIINGLNQKFGAELRK
ncbi:MAG: phenylalanine--tRNA ligase subunit beta [bacterium]